MALTPVVVAGEARLATSAVDGSAAAVVDLAAHGLAVGAAGEASAVVRGLIARVR